MWGVGAVIVIIWSQIVEISDRTDDQGEGTANVPHPPDIPAEVHRIEAAGGCISHESR